MAALFASVPEPVKIISLGAQSANFAIASRASSTSFRTSLPEV